MRSGSVVCYIAKAAGELPVNVTLEKLPGALAAAVEAYGRGVVLMVVQPGERNAYDQQVLLIRYPLYLRSFISTPFLIPPLSLLSTCPPFPPRSASRLLLNVLPNVPLSQPNASFPHSQASPAEEYYYSLI